MDGLTFWFMATLAAFFVGLGKGGVPVITAMAVPLMSLVMSPILAAGLLLPVFIMADIGGVYAYRRSFHPRLLKIMLVAMPIGVLFGWATAAYVSDGMVTMLIGLIGVAFALNMILRRPVQTTAVEPRWKPGLFWGAISGFTSFVCHAGSPPYQVYALPLGLDKITYAGTVAVAFAYVNLVKLIPYYALGQLSLDNLKIAFFLPVPAILGVFVGVRMVKVMPEKLFFRIIIWALLVVSIKLIWDGFGQL
jgi:uncharacterized membrane protein YfcA